MSDNMNEALNKFIKYIENERMYSEYTILNYKKDVLEFEQWLKKESFGDLLKPIGNAGRYYTSHLNEHYRKPRSVSRKLSSLRSFYKYCVREGMCERNPFASMGDMF